MGDGEGAGEGGNNDVYDGEVIMGLQGSTPRRSLVTDSYPNPNPNSQLNPTLTHLHSLVPP